MTVLYDFPKQALFGRNLPKTKIYEHGTPKSSVKKLFVSEVEKIIWSYKLSPETINLAANGAVQEIQVFNVELKTGSLNHEVLQAIDKAIPSPILFQLLFNNKIRIAAAYKRPSEADKSKWVVSSYFESTWVKQTRKKVSLPVVLDLKALYQTLLLDLIPIPMESGETLNDLVLRVDRFKVLEREAGKLEARMNKEKQYNRKVELNAELRKLKKEMNELKG